MSDGPGLLVPNPWEELRRFTPARIALGRAGPALPTGEVLRLALAHARARDAVHRPLDVEGLDAGLRAAGHATVRVRSAARDRAEYLARPDLGRRLDEASAARLEAHAGPAPDLAVVVADGLSALAVERHALPFLEALRARSLARWGGPVAIAVQGRVALGDEIGERLGAGLVAILIGERPGLSSPDSLGAYLTFAPRAGRTDAERNCLSNVRPEGLGYAEAARRLDWLAGEALRRRLTGVALKDESGTPGLGGPPPGGVLA
jgi:ethanolamine ammonia-lyase small subunit